MAKLIFDKRNYSTTITYPPSGITFTQDGYIITHDVVYNGTGTATLLQLIGGSTGSMIFQTAANQTLFLDIGTEHQMLVVLKNPNLTDYAGTYIPTWKNLTTYSLSLNGTTSTTNYYLNNSLGTFYAPISAGTQYQILQSNGSGAPGWLTLTTDLTTSTGNGATEDYGVPTSHAVRAAIAAGFAANDAMVFKGVTGTPTTSGIQVVTPTSDSAGYTWRVGTEGYFDKSTGKLYSTSISTATAATMEKVEVGDLIICVNDGSSSANATYSIVQTNIANPLSYTNLGGTDSNLTRYVKRNTTTGYLYIDQIMRSFSYGGTAVTFTNAYDAINFIGNNSIAVGNGGANGTIQFYISNSVTAQSTTGIYKFAHNSEGLITASSSWNPDILTFKDVYNSATATTSKSNITYDPDGSARTLFGGAGIKLYSTDSGSSIAIAHTSKYGGSATADSSIASQVIRGITIDDEGHITKLYTGTDINTWRPVNAWKLSELTNSDDTIDQILDITPPSTGTNNLSFGPDFAYDDTNNILELCWMEISSTGTITYTV